MPGKKDSEGNWTERRFCVDFRKINSRTEQDRYQPQLAEELFADVGGAKFFSKLDLRAGFHQIPFTPEIQQVTAFWWGSKLFCYKRMPFGLKNATAAFQRIVDYELGRRELTHCSRAFVDDIIIFSDTIEEHIQHVADVITCLKDCGLRAHPDKSIFGADAVEYLGHMVSKSGLTPTEAKIASVREMKSPSNVSEIRSAMGFMNYLRCYVPNFSAIAQPINKLLGKGVAWDWGEEQEKAFNQL
jgi:hypothetical protein